MNILKRYIIFYLKKRKGMANELDLFKLIQQKYKRDISYKEFQRVIFELEVEQIISVQVIFGRKGIRRIIELMDVNKLK